MEAQREKRKGPAVPGKTAGHLLGTHLQHATENPFLCSPTRAQVQSNNDGNWEGTCPLPGSSRAWYSQGAPSLPRQNLFKPTEK